MITLAGGKLTTARAFAAQVLAQIATRLGRPRPMRRPRPAWDADGVPSRLAEIYGRRALEIQALLRQHPELDRPVCASSVTTAAEIVHAVQREKALTLGDILLRRTGLAFEPAMARDCAAEAARVAAPLLGWDEAGIAKATDAYYQELSRTLYRGRAS